MTTKHEPLVKEVATNKPTGAQTFAISGTAVTNFRSFASAYTNGDVIPVFASNADNSMWEESECTLSTGVLTRTTILKSSNANAAVDFSGSATDVTLKVTSLTAKVEASEQPLIEAARIAGYGFFVRSDGNIQTVTDSSWQNIVGGASGALHTVEWNVSSVFSADANGRFTPPAGRWLVGGCVTVDLVTASQRILVGIRKNNEATPGRLLSRSGTPSTTNTTGLGNSTIVQANGTDYFNLALYVDGSGTHSVGTTAGFTSFWAQYLGPVL